MSEVTPELHVKYRPKRFERVLGQDFVVASIRDAIEGQTGRAFMLSGPSGTGKTTLARIIARTVGADPGGVNYLELDAATKGGVDGVREVQNLIQFKTLDGGARVVCYDESHRLSAAAVDALLKPVEEAPPGLWWVFCTTEPTKMAKTLRNRCLQYELRPVDAESVLGLLTAVVDAEEGEVDPAVLNVCVDYAAGSPRQALTALARVWQCGEVEARSLLNLPGETPEMVELCRQMLNASATYPNVRLALSKMKDPNAEAFRRMVMAYFTRVEMGGGKYANKSLRVLQAFERPYPEGAMMGSFLISLNEALA